ncbi:MAG TPA: acyl-phosphate glycerol 3-phosphate acyltransferase [Aminobacterium sp.]|uniref:glycerol-3-phosphate 1-O-acyltransferase PlsY n=1 Tax=Aminobacterium TaxID=81466 RepID=UPI000ED77D28|nr:MULTISPECIES: glycerol-3-phosphate 1-O-acyltransferase PlsY [unclassified Aminobacterium]HCA41416.1 acyl-phosphate glycerol 3-phosphate acyltransferase [Aminobacterium sp.]
MSYWLWIFAAYLTGSFPTGYVCAKVFRGVDIRTFGSGNIGATNVGRLMGRPWAIGVTIVDMLKGGIILIIARKAGIESPVVLASIAFASICGHNFPLWLNFKGGKGVATTYGVVFFMVPPWSSVAALIAGGIWYIVMRWSKYVSVASILSLFTLPLLFLLFHLHVSNVLAVSFMAILALVRHRNNIARIRRGEEGRVGEISPSKKDDASL